MPWVSLSNTHKSPMHAVSSRRAYREDTQTLAFNRMGGVEQNWYRFKPYIPEIEEIVNQNQLSRYS